MKRTVALAAWLFLFAVPAVLTPETVNIDPPAVPRKEVQNAPSYMHLVPTKYRNTVHAAAVAWNVPAWFVARLIYNETNGSWNPMLVSPLNSNGTRDIGLAQANSAYLDYYAASFDLDDPYDATQSIYFAAHYSSYLYNKLGSWYAVAAAYKLGLTGYSVRCNSLPQDIELAVRWIALGV